MVEIESQWDNGYCAGIRVYNNTEEPIVITTLAFTLPESVQITQSWNGEIQRTGDAVQVTLPEWVQFSPIEPGSTQKHFGFCAAGSSLPSEPTAQQ